jgi:C1A family cysteine protease
MDAAPLKNYHNPLLILFFIFIGGIMFHLILAVLLYWQTSISNVFADDIYPNVIMVETVGGLKATGYRGIWDKNNAPYRTIETGYRELPTSFDYRTVSGVLNDVRDQGTCGSCWSFSITSVLESSVVVQTPRTLTDLSEQHMVSCDYKSYGCNGGFMESADFVVRNGLTDEQAFPYTGKQVRCKQGLKTLEKAAKYYLIGTKTRAPTTAEIKTALVEYGPVFVSVKAGGMGWAGTTPKVTSCSKRGTANHMVVIVGYDEKGWIIRNSWGSEWADKGYAHIGYGCDLIGEDAGYVVVD